MLVLSRQRGEVIVIGDRRTLMVQLTSAEELALLKCADPSIRPIAARMLAAIGTQIQLTTVDIRGDKVRTGIAAPKEIPVHRQEVYDLIRRNNRAAATAEDLAALGKTGAEGGETGWPQDKPELGTTGGDASGEEVGRGK